MNRDTETKFLEAYDAYADAIFRHCYFRVYNHELARDIMQETYTRTWRYLLSGNDLENIRAFLYRVANNLIIDNSRKKSFYSLDELQEKGFDPPEHTEDIIVNTIDAKRALEFLPHLPDSYRAVFVMRYIDDLSPKEIAAATGETENAVSVRIHRAAKKLREYIEQELHTT